MVRTNAASKPNYWILTALITLAIALRLRGLVSFPFDQDELYTVIESTQLFHTTLRPGIGARPLYYLIEHVLLSVYPATPFALRFLPFVCGVAGVAATWRLGHRLFGSIGGLLAGTLSALSPWLVYTSGFARYWSLIYLLSAIFFYYLVIAYESDRVVHYVGAATSAVLATFTHPTFLFAAAGAAIGVSVVRQDGRFGVRWPSRRAWLCLWVPWAAATLALSTALRMTGHLEAYRNFGGRGALSTLRLLPAILQWMSPTVFVAGSLGAAFLLFVREKPHLRRFGSMSLFGCATAILLLLAAATRTDVYADYGIAMLPLLFVSAGGLIALAAEQLTAGRRSFSGAAAAVLVAGMLPYTASHLSDGTRFDYRPALREIETTAPTIPVLTWPIIISRFYSPQLDLRELKLEAASLEAAVAASADLWVVLSVREYGVVGDDAAGSGAAWIGLHCQRVRENRRLRFDSRQYEVVLNRCRKPVRPERAFSG